MDKLRHFWQTTPPKLLPLARAIDRLNEGIGQLALWIVPVMVGLGVWNVIGRFLGRSVEINLTSNALIEGQWYLFSLLFFLGAAYALKHNEHVRVDLFYNYWSPRRRAWVNLLGTVFFLLPVCLVVIGFSWDAIAQSWKIWETSPDPGGLIRYPIKSFIIISFLLLIIQGLAEIIENWAKLTGHLPLEEETTESEV